MPMGPYGEVLLDWRLNYRGRSDVNCYRYTSMTGEHEKQIARKHRRDSRAHKRYQRRRARAAAKQLIAAELRRLESDHL